MTSDFDRIRDTAISYGKPVHDTRDGYWVGSHEDGVYTDAPYLTVTRLPSTLDVDIRFRYTTFDIGNPTTADEAIDKIQGRWLVPRRPAERIYSAALASGYHVQPNGLNSMMVTHLDDAEMRDPANRYLVLTVRDGHPGGDEILLFTGSHEDSSITAETAVSLIEEGSL